MATFLAVTLSPNSSAPSVRVPDETLVRDFRRATRKRHYAEDKIRSVLEGLRVEESTAALCRREAVAEGLYYAWPVTRPARRPAIK